MIHVSSEFRELIKKRTDFQCHADVTLTDGKTLSFGAEDFAVSGNRLTDGASAQGLPLGVAICRTVELELANDDGHLDAYDFFGAKIRLWLTYQLTETVERVELGTFTVTEPETEGETVTITGADDMYKADKPYTAGDAGAATLGGLWRDVCDQCGLHYDTAEFRNSDFIPAAVADGEYTCRQMLGYIALLAGGNARVNRRGSVEILTYDQSRTPDHDLSDWSRLNVETSEAVITGLEAETETGTILAGEEGYVLQIDDPLIEGREEDALALLAGMLVGMHIRRFDGEYIAYPLAECMDTVRFTDRRGRGYTSVITDVTFAFGGLTTLANSAESAVHAESRYASEGAQAKIAARKLAEQEKTARERAVDALNKKLEEAGGLYCTVQEQEDGSSIYYLHDKPQLADSQYVMKLTAEAIGFSADGGKSYPYGFTVTGEMVMGILESEGVNADWINAGTINLELLVISGMLGGIKEGYGKTADGRTTKGLLIWGPNGLDKDGNAVPPYIILTDAGWRVQISDEISFGVAGTYAEMHGNISVTGSVTCGGSVYFGSDGSGGILASIDGSSYRYIIRRDGSLGRAFFSAKNDDTYIYGKTLYINDDDCVTTIRGSSISSTKQIVGSSDRALKKDIEALPAEYERLLDGMAPVRYRYRDEPDGGPYHIGYIAQDVEAALEAAVMDRGDLAALTEIPQEDGTRKLGIAYGELVPLLHAKIKRLEARLEKLEGTI